MALVSNSRFHIHNFNLQCVQENHVGFEVFELRCKKSTRNQGLATISLGGYGATTLNSSSVNNTVCKQARRSD